MRFLLSASLLFTLVPSLQAQPFKMEPGPKSPGDSLACIKTRPGFKVELMVSEPLVQSPIAFAWGPDGKFWVVEMGDYPLGLDGKGKPGGKIKYLEKTKPEGDGPYDKMTLFMDGLGFPTGVFPYKNGVLVTCAPDIFYAEVGKDGKAAKKEILFTGFNEGNQQHRVNGLVWGIDNWIYGANGDSGGLVKSIKTGKVTDIRGRDFRLKPDTGEFEAVSGQSQFGRCRDDWGNWFGNNNSNPMFHYVLEDRYLKRNPHVLYPDVRVQVPVKPGAQPVFPISKPLPRFNTPQGLNHFTSACSTIIYRDTLFGKEFEGNMFVSEPVHNLIHREIMKPKGVTFTSQRADDEQTSEFLASSDNWFRPAMIQVGPDGALWIADMYRYVIEHPEWIPKDWQKKLDLRAGHDKGRIYRVVPEGRKPRDIERLDKKTPRELVSLLESPSGWTRDMAHQLLSRTKHGMGIDGLEKIIETTKVPPARLHACYVHEEMFGLGHQYLDRMLNDSHPSIRKHALAFAEYRPSFFTDEALTKLLEERDPQCQMQIAYILGELKFSNVQLAKILCKEGQDGYIFAAALSSISKKNFQGVLDEAIKQPKISAAAFGPLMKLAGVYGEPLDAIRLFVSQIETRKDVSTSLQLVYVANMINAMEKNASSLSGFLKGIKAEDNEKIIPHLKKLHAKAVEIVENSKAPPADRFLAIRMLSRGIDDNAVDRKRLAALLTPQSPDDLQSAAINQLRGDNDARVPNLLLAPWKSYSPALRGQVLDALLSHPLWTRQMLETIKLKKIPPSEIDAVRRQRLLQHKDAEIRATAQAIFGAAGDPNRGKLVDLYWLQMPDKADPTRGGKLFAKTCATCHKLGGVGQNVGPDLMSVGDKSAQGLLTAMLDPNRAVETRYINYAASTKKGLTYTGILSAETSTTITLTANDGKLHQLLRNELDDLSSTGKSMMPEGLEKDMSPRDVADVIGYVRAIIAAPKQ